MRRLFLFLLALLAFVCPANTQTAADPNEGARLIYDSNGHYTFSWWGRAGRTYFVQHSEDLITWDYWVVVESGNDDLLSYGFSTTGEKCFLRLQFSDLPTADPFDADFDGDRVSNLDELFAGLDPLHRMDSDGDDVPDDWEIVRLGGLNQSGGDYDRDGLSDAEEFAGGTDPEDYYNGVAPVLSFSAASNPPVDFGFTLPGPVVVTVKNAAGEPLVNAPIYVSTSEGMMSLAEDSSLVRFAISGGFLTDHLGNVTLTLLPQFDYGHPLVVESGSAGTTFSESFSVPFSVQSLSPLPFDRVPPPVAFISNYEHYFDWTGYYAQTSAIYFAKGSFPGLTRFGEYNPPSPGAQWSLEEQTITWSGEIDPATLLLNAATAGDKTVTVVEIRKYKREEGGQTIRTETSKTVTTTFIVVEMDARVGNQPLGEEFNLPLVVGQKQSLTCAVTGPTEGHLVVRCAIGLRLFADGVQIPNESRFTLAEFAAKSFEVQGISVTPGPEGAMYQPTRLTVEYFPPDASYYFFPTTGSPYRIPVISQQADFDLQPVEMSIASRAGASADSDLLPSGQNLTSGGYVPINANNDNGSEIKKVDGVPTWFPEKRDFDADHLPKDDDELVRLKLSVPHSLPFTARLRIENAGRARIKLWKDRRKNELFLADGQVDKSFAELPDELWIEGVKEGEVEREVTLYLEIIAGTQVSEGGKIKVTVAPILQSYRSDTAFSDQPQFGLDFYGDPVLWCAVTGQPEKNVWVEANILKKNTLGTGKQIQVLDVNNPVAATVSHLSGGVVRTYRYQFAPPSVGKTLNDCGTVDRFPFYINANLPPETIGDVLRIKISDSPYFSLTPIVPQVDQYVDVDMTWRFKVYAVWEFPDKTVYPLGRTEWNIHWAGRFGTLQTPGSPPTYLWSSDAANKNNVSDQFERSNAEPTMNLPPAGPALNAAGGGFQ